MNKFRIRLGDNVMVITGKDADKDVPRKVLKIIRKRDCVLVEKTNMVKRHMRPNPYAHQPGGIVEKEMPIHVSNVMVVCPACHKPTRIGYRYIEANGKRKKVRFCKKCNEVME